MRSPLRLSVLLLLPVLVLVASSARGLGAEAPLPERLDRLVAAALAELDRLERAGTADAPAARTEDPPPTALPVRADALTLRRLRRLLGRIDALLAEVATPADPLVGRLVAGARRAVSDAYRTLGDEPPKPDAALVRTALLRTDAASAALWSLQPRRPP